LKLHKLVECSRLDLDGESLFATVSVGATLLLPDDTPGSLISRADKLMYQSKQVGRNHVALG
jgi:PleD family two-component response regulator